jgi:hypothetical protein
LSQLPVEPVLWAVHVLGLEAFGAFLDLKLYFRALLQTPVAGHLDCGKMNKDVLAARSLDESIAFRGVKPFNDTLFSHYNFSYFFPGSPGTSLKLSHCLMEEFPFAINPFQAIPRGL